MNIRNKSDFIIVTISLVVFSAIRTIYSLSLINWSEYEKGYLSPSFLFWIDIIVYFVIFTLFLLYGWYIRRDFVKKNLEQGDYPSHYVIKIFIIIYIPIFIFILVISFLTQIDQKIFYSASILNETIQMMFFGTLIGTLFYNQIDQFFSKFIKPSKYQRYPSKELSFVEQSTVKIISRFWNYTLYMILSFLFLANFIVLIIYPSIPATYNPNIKLIIAYPNFSFNFNPETGIHQEIFTYVELDYTKFLNWKLIQSLLCILFILAVALLYYIPLLQNKIYNNLNEEEKLENIENQANKKTDQEETTIFSPQQELNDANELTLQQELDSIISPTDQSSYYTPEGLIKNRSRRFTKFISRVAKSDVVPVMNLAALNIGFAMLFVYFLKFFLPSMYSSYEISDLLYIQLSSFYWAGLFEELSFRFLIFGLPLFFIHGIHYLMVKFLRFLKSKKENKIAEKEEKEENVKYRNLENPFLYLTGRWKKLQFIDIIFLLISSFLFGYVHYQFGSWDKWKILQAGIAGIIFGYAFYKFGLHAAIFLHTVNDFAIGIMLVPNLGLVVQGVFIVFLLVLMGIMYSFYVIILFLKKISNLHFKKSNKQTEVS